MKDKDWSPISNCEYYWNIPGVTYKDGYIIYKGRKIEHFNSDYAETEAARDYVLKLISKQ